jgi:multicomponent Na+:H+ antiporter subunit G
VSALEIVAAVMILSGVALNVLATIGLHRFPDVFARMHAASKPATLGLALALTGTALVLGQLNEVMKLALVVAFQFLTAPIAAHMVGRAAYRAGTELSPETTVDELAGALDRPSEPDAGGPDPI